MAEAFKNKAQELQTRQTFSDFFRFLHTIFKHVFRSFQFKFIIQCSILFSKSKGRMTMT